MRPPAPPLPSPEASDTVFFGDLDPSKLTPRALADLCTQAGPVAEVRWPPPPGGPADARGAYAFVRFGDGDNGAPASASAAYAVALFSNGGVALFGRRPRVELSGGS